MLMTVAKNHNVWVVQIDKLKACCCCFGWHAGNVQQQDLPSTEKKQPELWNVACIAVNIASASLQRETQSMTDTSAESLQTENTAQGCMHA